MITILSVVGARPNFMKIAPLARAFGRFANVRHVIVHTGQHYDDAMSDVFFRDLDIPTPDRFLGVGSGTHAEQTARIMTAFERVVAEIRPDAVVVVGDVNSTLACSIVCAKMSVPVAHVEAGLRSFDRTMPEEINRIVTDALADWLFVSEPSGVENLEREGKPDGKIFFVGNVMIDTLIAARSGAEACGIMPALGLESNPFILVTLHRPSNVDDRGRMLRLLELLRDISERARVIFPMHPRTKKMIEAFGLTELLAPYCTVIDPLGYREFMSLLGQAACVVTDSGGIQEESTYLGIPCITLRENTERPVTVSQGTNLVVGDRYDDAIGCVDQIMQGRGKKGTIPALWDGHAAERIADILLTQLSGTNL